MAVEMENRAKLTAAERDALPDSAFALPGRRYPIHDLNHAHVALSEVAQHGTPEEKSKVRAAVHKRYPAIDVGGSQSGMDRQAFELRRRRRGSMGLGCSERRGMLLEVRAKPDGTGGTAFEFEGYGAVFNAPFDMWDKWGEPYSEVVMPGAFTESLSRRDLDVPFLIGHDESRLALARTKNGTMQLAQDTHGLHVRASLDGRRSDVRDLAYAVERGDMDEMSIGFVTRQHKWSEDYETRSMLNLDLHRGDVSPVALAANAATAGSSVAFPTETLSRAHRAQLTQADADDQDHDHMIPMVGPNHPAFTGRHSHAHPAFDGPDADGDGMHGHDHEHNGDNLHQHSHAGVEQGPTPGGVADDYDMAALADGRPLEHRGNPVALGLGDAAEYNVWPHTAPGTRRCTSPSCTVDGGAMNHPDARFCDQCGGSLSGDDALVRLNDDGVPGMTEEHGEVATLALRQRRLELLKLTAR